MTKQEFTQSLVRLRAERLRIIKEMEHLEREYIAANKPCNEGDVVVVRRHGGEEVKGVVGHFTVDYNNNVIPLLFRLGKQTNTPIRVSPVDELVYPAPVS